jgi:hypothetical protein
VRRPRPVASAIAALVVATVVLGAAPASGSAQVRAAAQAPTVRLLGRTPWVGDGFDFELSLQVAAAPAGSTVRLQVHDRVRSRSEFARTVDGEALRDVEWVDGPRPLADGPGPVSFVVPIAPAPDRVVAPIDAAGVYPVSIAVFDADGETVAALHTHLVRLAPLDPESEELPLDVAVVARFGDEPVDVGPLAAEPPAAPEALVEAATALAAALAAHPDLGINLSVLPENLAALDAQDPALVDELAGALAASELLGEPWVAVDEAAWDDADPALLAQLRSRGSGAVDDGLGRRPGTARVAAGESLASVRVSVDHGTELVVLDEAALEPLDTEAFPYTLARPFLLDLSAPGPDGGGAEEPDDPDEADDAASGATVTAVAADAALGAHAEGADDDPVLAASLVLADLAVIADDEPSSARLAVVGLPASATASPEFLSTLLDGLEPPEAPPAPPPPTADPETGEVPEPTPPTPAAAPRLRTATLTDAVAAVDLAGADGILAGPEDPLVRPLVEGGDVSDVETLARILSAGRVDLASYRTIFGDGDALADRAEALLDTMAADDVGDATREEALTSVAAHIDDQLARIEAPPLQRVTLTDREGLVQLVFSNDTGLPAEVLLVMRADRLVLPDAPDGTMHVRLEPDITRVELRVEARSSGDAPLDIRVTSPDGRLAVAETRVAVRTTAVSGVGVVLMVGALAFLAVWWTRTIVREHRARRPPAHEKRT